MTLVEASVPVTAHHALDADQYRSVDSSPRRYARPVPLSAAPQALAICLVMSAVLVYLMNNWRLMEQFFPEHDFYLSRYEGTYTVPIRIFIISFYTGFASAIAATPLGKLRHWLDLVVTYWAACLVFDLMNGLLAYFTGYQLPLHVAMVISGLGGLMLFSLKLLDNGDLPEEADAPFDAHFRPTSFGVALIAIAASGIISIRVTELDLPGVHQLREVALLGGIGPGVFLFLPLLFILLNWVAAIRDLLFSPRRYAPPVTVIVPAYNEAHMIGHTLRFLDIAAARYPGETYLLVIDNNSTDDTAMVAQMSIAGTPHLHGRLVTETRPGKAHALTRGIAEAETEFVIRIDADTQISPDAITRIMRHFRDPHVGAAGGLALSPGGGPFDGARALEVNLKAGLDQVAYGAADCIFGIPGMFTAYRTRAVRRIGGFAHGMNGEDTDMAVRIGECGYRLVVDPTATYVSEVPRTYAHLREQRTRWFRSIFHVCARNRLYFRMRDFSVRSKLMMPYMLLNTARRAMSLPLLLSGLIFLAMAPDPRSNIFMQAVLAFVLGAPLIMVIFATLVLLRFRDLLSLPSYLAFRMIRSYLTLESMLSITFNRLSGVRRIPLSHTGHLVPEPEEFGPGRRAPASSRA